MFTFDFIISGSLMFLNEATLLNNIRLKYKKDSIYVSVYHKLYMIMI